MANGNVVSIQRKVPVSPDDNVGAIEETHGGTLRKYETVAQKSVIGWTCTPSVNSSITTTSGQIIASNDNRVSFELYNDGTVDVYLNWGAAATTSHWRVPVGATFISRWESTQAIHAITASGTGQLRIREVSVAP